MAHHSEGHDQNVVGDGKGEVLPHQPGCVPGDSYGMWYGLKARAQEDKVGSIPPDVCRRRGRH